MKRILLILFVIILVILGVIFFPNLVISPIGTTPAEKTEQEVSEEIELIFVGDIMLDRNVENRVNSVGNGDYRFPFELIKEELNKADITVGNLETTISQRGWPTRELYLFRVPPSATESLSYAGFDFLSVANNHAGDYARPAFEDTINFLKSDGIEPVGGGMDKSEAYGAKFIEIKNTTIAFLAFSDFAVLNPTEDKSGVVTTFDEDLMWSSIKKAKETADITVVLFHYGDEYEPEPNQRQINLSRKAVDFGADLIVGGHPHVIQSTEQYKEGYIAYSLGNFIFDQDFSEETMTGGLLRVKIKDQKIQSFGLERVYLNDNYQPSLSES